MKKHQFNGIDETYYFEKLANGLKVVLMPSDKVKGYYITFSTKFGNVNNEFKYRDEANYHQVPFGTAHYLEHQLCESEIGISLFKEMSKYGAYVNAYTSCYQTLFEVQNNVDFPPCLKTIINSVQHLSINEETVSKGRGIILEELRDSLNSPNQVSDYILGKQMYFNAKERYSVLGEEEDIKQISVDDLKLCHEYFYQPGNMVLVITGNFDIKKAIKIIRHEQKLINYPKYKRVLCPKDIEPVKVKEKYSEKEMTVSVPKVTIAYKISLKRFKHLGISKIQFRHYLAMILNCNFGVTSELNEYILDNKLTIDGLNIGYRNHRNDVLIITFSFQSRNTNIVLKLIHDKLCNLKTEENDYLRKKKTAISDFILTFDNIYDINNFMTNDLHNYGKIIEDDISIIKSYDFKQLVQVEDIIKHNVNNSSVVKIIPHKN